LLCRLTGGGGAGQGPVRELPAAAAVPADGTGARRAVGGLGRSPLRAWTSGAAQASARSAAQEPGCSLTRAPYVSWRCARYNSGVGTTDQLQAGGRRRLTGSEPSVSDSTGAPSSRLGGRRPVEGLSLLLFLVASMIYLEIVLRIQTDSQVVGDGLLYTTLFAGATSFVIFLIASFLRGAGRTIVVGLLLGAMTVIFMSQFLYYDTFRTFYSVFSAMNGGQLTEFMGVILVKIRENLLWLLLLAVP